MIQSDHKFAYLITAKITQMLPPSKQSIVLFYNNFSPSGEQPENLKLAHEL